MGGASSTTKGYVFGIQNNLGNVGNYPNVNEVFTFASNSTITLLGQDHGGRHGGYGHSSTTHGYFAGGIGNNPPSGPSNGAYNSNQFISKWSFASDVPTNNVANLVIKREYGGFTHV